VLNFPLVLVPALGSDERLWQPVVDRIEDLVECVVIRGEGDTIESMADSVLAQAPPEFYLAGNSMGGYVSLEIALRQTGRVHGLALLNTSAIAAPPDRRENSIQLIELAESGGFDAAVDRISGAVAPHRPDVAAIAASMARDLGVEVFTAQQLAVLNRRDRRSEVPGLDVPTLVVAGAIDVITPPRLSKELAESLTDAELVVLPDVGHLSALEDPAGIASNVRHWLLRIANQMEAHR
jgi:pimeloyl-ACP methyl ester carboxylesterase